MGYNQFGQLGLGHLNNGEENMNAAQICKFTNSTSPFIVDVQATVCGASFAITESGQAYRWGYNQVDETQFPIYDRFNSIINYSATPIFYKSANPTIITYSFHNKASITFLLMLHQSKLAVISSWLSILRERYMDGVNASILEWLNSRIAKNR